MHRTDVYQYKDDLSLGIAKEEARFISMVISFQSVLEIEAIPLSTHKPTHFCHAGPTEILIQ